MIFHFPRERNPAIESLKSAGLIATNLQFVDMGAYLGIRIGLNDFADSWRLPVEKYRLRLSFCKNLNAGLTQAMISYNVLAMSVLAHVAQVSSPTELVRRCQREGLQALKEIGFPVQAVDIVRYAAAAQYRLARRFGVFRRLIDECHDILDGSNWLVAHESSPRLINSMFYQSHGNWRRLNCISRALDDPWRKEFQKCVLAQLNMHEAPVTSYLQARTNYWMKDCRIGRNDDTLMLIRMSMISAQLPCFVLASVLKTACNGWATSARYCQPLDDCRFGCKASSCDAIPRDFSGPHF
eukprot:8400559-Pyramimonas_sp.AAC.1